MAKTKVCRVCKKRRSVTKFYTRNDTKNKLRSVCIECTKRIETDRRVAIRIEVLNHYSNGDTKFDCCGETTIEFLCLDHIDGGGNKERIRLKKTGSGFYSWIRTNNYPKGFRVLCCNCNQSLGAYGYCPHNKK